MSITLDEARSRVSTLVSNDGATAVDEGILADIFKLNAQFYGKYHYGILTTQAEGLAAVRAAVEEIQHLYHINPAVRYYRARIPGDQHTEREIIFANASNLGRSSTAILATNLYRDFPNLKDVVLVGTASKAPDAKCHGHDVVLGDVVVSTSGMAEFELVKLPHDLQMRSHSQASATLTDAVDTLAAADMETGKKPTWHADLWRTLGQMKDSNRPLSKVKPGKANKGKPSAEPPLPVVHKGRIASAPVLLKHPDRAAAWPAFSNVLALEHDEFGVFDVNWMTSISFITVRGIATYCAAETETEWVRYASCTSAAYAVALIRAVRVPAHVAAIQT